MKERENKQNSDKPQSDLTRINIYFISHMDSYMSAYYMVRIQIYGFFKILKLSSFSPCEYYKVYLYTDNPKIAKN